MEIVFNLIVGIFIVFYMALSFLFDKRTVSGDVFGSGGFPILLACLGLVVLGLIMWQSLRNKTKVEIPMLDIKTSSGKTLILSIGVLSLYLLIMNIIGYVLSTFIFAIGSARVLGYKKILALFVFTISLSVILTLAFGNIFFVPLPRGMGIFKDLSYYIY